MYAGIHTWMCVCVCVYVCVISMLRRLLGVLISKPLCGKKSISLRNQHLEWFRIESSSLQWRVSWQEELELIFHSQLKNASPAKDGYYVSVMKVRDP